MTINPRRVLRQLCWLPHRIRARLTCWRRGHDDIPIWIRAEDNRSPDGQHCKRCYRTTFNFNGLLLIYYQPAITDILNQPRILSRYLGRNPPPTQSGTQVGRS